MPSIKQLPFLGFRTVSNRKLIDAVHKHLGRPWSAHGFDCWECVRAIYFDAYGITLAQFQIETPGDHHETMTAIDEQKKTGKWEMLGYPEDGCFVAIGKREWPHHIGIYLAIDGGKIVHCLENIGCVVDSVSSLKISGWGFMQFYKLGNK